MWALPSGAKRRTVLAALLASASLSSLARADFTATGQVLYVDRSFTYNGWTGAKPELPVRHVRVEVRNANTNALLGFSHTDANGNYSIQASGSGTANVKIRLRSRSEVFGNNDLIVRQVNNVEYTLDSPTFSNHNLSSDLNAGVLVAPTTTVSGDQGNPWNILDQCVYAVEYVKAQGEGNPTSNVVAEWPGGSGSFASGSLTNIAQDDGYDDCVILHELGHVLHNIYSDSDNPGGGHFFGDSDQDPRLSYGEGYATFFNAAVRQFVGVNDPGIYLDAVGGGSTGGVQLRARMENLVPYQNDSRGEADEVAVAGVLWDLVDTVATTDPSTGTDDDDLDGSLLFNGGIDGDTLNWNVLVGPVATASNLTIRDHFHGYFNPVNAGLYDEIADAFDNHGCRFFADTNEPNNNAGSATAYTPSSNWGAIQTLYYSPNNPPAPGNNDRDFYAFHLNEGAIFQCATRYPNNANDADTYCDTFLTVRRPDGTTFATNDDGGTGRNAQLTNLVADATGTWTVEVDTTHPYRRTGSYQFRAIVDFDPGPPASGLTIDSIAPGNLPAVVVDGPGVVTLTGSGFNDVTKVLVDGVELGVFPPQYVLVSNTQMTVKIPLASSLGAVEIRVETATESATVDVNLEANDPPVLELVNSSPGFLLGAIGAEVIVGGQPGDQMFVLLSASNQPSVLPGLFSLDIGNNFANLFLVHTAVIGPAGYDQVALPFSGVSTGTTLYFQALRSAGALPLDTTNMQVGVVLF